MTDEAQEIVDRFESTFNLAARDARTHFHPIYATLHCGCKTGIQGGKPEEIDCPDCLKNFADNTPGPREKLVAEHAKAMLNTLKLPKNVEKGHWSTESLEGLLRHLDEEVEEFKAAIWGNTSFGKPHSRVVSEGADISNVVAMITDNLGHEP
jgi:hypothetical protein